MLAIVKDVFAFGAFDLPLMGCELCATNNKSSEASGASRDVVHNLEQLFFGAGEQYPAIHKYRGVHVEPFGINGRNLLSLLS